jgi:hypothetical protein
MQIPVVYSLARRTVLLGADFAQYDAEFRQDLYRVGPTLPAAAAVEAQTQAHIELPRLSYISHSSARVSVDARLTLVVHG